MVESWIQLDINTVPMVERGDYMDSVGAGYSGKKWTTRIWLEMVTTVEMLTTWITSFYSGKKVQCYMDIAGDGHRWKRGLVLHKATVMGGYRRTKLEVRIVIWHGYSQRQLD